MAKIDRYNGNLEAFARDALGTERTIFGDTAQSDALTDQINADFLRGWGIVGPSDQPTLQDFNAMGYTHGQLLAYLHQAGVPEYNATQEYHIGSITNEAGVLYSSLIDDNLGNTPSSSPAQWRELYAQATETVRGTAKLATQALAEAGVNDTDIMTPLKVKQAIDSQSGTSTDGIAGAFSNLKASATGLSALVTVTADSICLKNSANEQVVLNSVSVTPSLAVSGVNGLDTGTSAASTWYAVWVIWNGTTAAGLLSLSSTAPALPVGYTHKARVGWVRSDSTGNKYPLAFTQSGKGISYKVGSSGNVLGLPILTSGTVGTIGTSTMTWATIGVSNFVPPTASRITVLLNNFATGALGVVYTAPNSNYAGPASTNHPQGNGNGAVSLSRFDMLLESTNIYVAAQAQTATHCVGWEDNL